jgi:hypothetical protein
MGFECQPQYLAAESAKGGKAFRECSAPGYLNIIVRFENGSCWKMTKALSDVKYQQGEPPFEAGQVFECTCGEDPNDAHTDVRHAVAKVKYQ